MVYNIERVKNINLINIIGAIWGKINFLGIVGVETHWVIGQKSQNSARYAGAFWGKSQ